MRKYILYLILFIIPFLQVLIFLQLKFNNVFINLIPGCVIVLLNEKNKLIYIYILYLGILVEFINLSPFGITSISLFALAIFYNYVTQRDLFRSSTSKIILFLFTFIVYELIQRIGLIILKYLYFPKDLFYNLPTSIVSDLIGLIVIFLIYFVIMNSNEKKIYLR